MLRDLKRFLIIGLVLVLSQAALAKNATLRDRPVPWPWGLEQPFPWNDIQGMWKIADDAGVPMSYFTFKVVGGKKTGIKQLVVQQMDAYTCDVIARGVGIELNDVLRAQMTTTEFAAEPSVTFRLSIRAFKVEKSPEPPIGILTNQVMVLLMTDLDRDPSKNLHIQIGKTSAKLDIKDCLEEKINF